MPAFYVNTTQQYLRPFLPLQTNSNQSRQYLLMPLCTVTAPHAQSIIQRSLVFPTTYYSVPCILIPILKLHQRWQKQMPLTHLLFLYPYLRATQPIFCSKRLSLLTTNTFATCVESLSSAAVINPRWIVHIRYPVFPYFLFYFRSVQPNPFLTLQHRSMLFHRIKASDESLLVRRAIAPIHIVTKTCFHF